MNNTAYFYFLFLIIYYIRKIQLNINPLISPDRAHTPTYITIIYEGSDYIRRAQRVNTVEYMQMINTNGHFFSIIRNYSYC